MAARTQATVTMMPNAMPANDIIGVTAVPMIGIMAMRDAITPHARPQTMMMPRLRQPLLR